MTPRAHHALRLCGLFLLVAASLWPRSRGEHPHRTSTDVAASTHLAVTTAARRATSDRPRPRAVREVDVALDPTDERTADAPTN